MGKKLCRSRRQKMIAGVCGGFAEYLDWDASIVRLVYIVLTLLFGSGILIYILAWIIIPLESPARDYDDDCIDVDYELKE